VVSNDEKPWRACPPSTYGVLAELAKASWAAPDKGYLPMIEAWNLPGYKRSAIRRSRKPHRRLATMPTQKVEIPTITVVLKVEIIQ